MAAATPTTAANPVARVGVAMVRNGEVPENKNKISIEEIHALTNLSENYSINELVDNCLAKNKQKTSTRSGPFLRLVGYLFLFIFGPVLLRTERSRKR